MGAEGGANDPKCSFTVDAEWEAGFVCPTLANAAAAAARRR